jgi:hypothetical protein
MAAFVTAGFLRHPDSKTVAEVIFTQVLLPNGIPKMVILDQDSLFKTDLVDILDHLGVPFHVVSPEQHEGILCERFHRYLNKVQRIQGLDTADFSIWMMKLYFAMYAWNASPIDGTDIVRSFAAKARTFNFPLDVQEEPVRLIGNPGERAVQHVETMFPLWFCQKALLDILTEERREKHRQYANANRQRRELQPGDIVVIRRQIQSDASTGRPAKLQMRARGPYRVLEKSGEDSYMVQRIPILQSLNRHPGKPQKQPAWRLERILSSVVVHKRVDSSDTRLLQQITEL